jgi:hypothetical protein
MSNISNGRRLADAIKLRNAAVALLEKQGKPEGSRGDLWFQRHTPKNPEPRLAVCLSKHPLHGHCMLNVWARVRGKHVKVLNTEWIGEAIDLTTFRRGEWEGELLAMALGMAVH